MENIENNTETVDTEQKIRAELEKKYKDAMDKASSEAKKYKDRMREAEDKLKTYMTDDERKQQEQADHYKAIEEENAKLKRDMTISQKTAFYQSIGFDGELARETAEAFVDGDFDTVEKNTVKAHEAFENNLRQQVREETVRNTPYPQNSGNTSGLTKEQIMKETNAIKRQKLIAENIDLFV